MIDSPSTDKTVEIVQEVQAFQKAQGGADVEVVVHKYPGNQAEQYNWAIDNLPIDTEWTMRIDADEYYLPELVEEMQQKVPTLPAEVTGIEFKRRHIFMGKWVKHGVYPVVMLRMCRTGKGRYEERLMDEHYTISEGRTIVMDNDFCDHSLINISDYCRKHLNYAQREAAEILAKRFEIRDVRLDMKRERLEVREERFEKGLGTQAKDKRRKKSGYNKLPLFWRSFAYFTYRYIFKGGFLDGKEGFLFAFIQGWWYRTMVDARILEVSKACGTDKEKVRQYIEKEWGISL